MKRLLAALIALCVVFVTAGCSDNAGKNVTITMPTFMLELTDIDPESFDAEQYCKDQNLVDAKINEDGSLTIVMSEDMHNAQLNEMIEQAEVAFDDYISSNVYVVDVSASDDYSSVTVTVDKAEYENAFDLSYFAVGVPALAVRMMMGEDVSTKIDIVDSSSGAVLNHYDVPSN